MVPSILKNLLIYYMKNFANPSVWRKYSDEPSRITNTYSRLYHFKKLDAATNGPYYKSWGIRTLARNGRASNEIFYKNEDQVVSTKSVCNSNRIRSIAH